MLGSKAGLWLALAGLVYSYSTHGAEPSISSVISAPSVTESKRRTTGDYQLELGGVSEQEGKDTAEGSYVYFSSNFNFQLTPSFRIKVSPWARFFSTRSQERFSDTNSGSFIFLYDAYGAFEPTPWLEFRGGVMSQSYLRNSMLVSSYASFPGAQAIFKTRLGRQLESKFIASQTIPTSHSDNEDRQASEPLPRFTTLTGELAGTPFKNFEIKAVGGYFEWGQMPSKVVAKSRLMGNVGVGEITPGSKFLYEHKGFFGTAEACLCYDSNVGFVGEFRRIHNTEAPGDAADAQLFGFGPRVKWTGMEFNFRYRSFFIESDATVAGYNRSRFGHTNRIGDNLEASLHFKEQKFTLFFEMFKAKPLNSDPNQKNLELYYFGVETDNVSFF